MIRIIFLQLYIKRMKTKMVGLGILIVLLILIIGALVSIGLWGGCTEIRREETYSDRRRSHSKTQFMCDPDKGCVPGKEGPFINMKACKDYCIQGHFQEDGNLCTQPKYGDICSLEVCRNRVDGKPQREYTKQNVIDMFNNEGLLTTMFHPSNVCPEYDNVAQWPKDLRENSCYKKGGPTQPCMNDINKCTFQDWTDLRNISNYKGNEPSENCFTLDLTYIQRKLPIMIFGPWSSCTNYSIGLLLDPKIIKQYVACMATIDAGSTGKQGQYTGGAGLLPVDGSTGRQGPYPGGGGLPPGRGVANPRYHDVNDPLYQITPWKLKYDYTDLITQNSGMYNESLAAVGCGYDDNLVPGGPTNKGYPFPRPPDKQRWIPDELPCGYNYSHRDRAWDGRNYQQYSRNEWDEWIDDLIKTGKNISNQIMPDLDSTKENTPPWNKCLHACPGSTPESWPSGTCNDFWSYMWMKGKETPPVYPKGYLMRGNSFHENELDMFIVQNGPPKISDDGKVTCDPHPVMLNDFSNAIVGVVVHPMCSDDVRYLGTKDGWPPTCCASDEHQTFLKEIAKKLAFTHNQKGYNKVHAYVLENAVKPGDKYTEWMQNNVSELKLEQLPELSDQLEDCLCVYDLDRTLTGRPTVVSPSCPG